MKQGWQIDTISSLCEQMNGIWKGEKEPLTTAKILRTTNFSKDCQMKLDDLAIIEVEQKKMEKRRLKRGDIIVEKSGGGPKQPVGRVILFNIDDDDFSFCNFTSALRIKDQTKILPEFLHKYLTYLYFSGETEKYQSNLVGFRNLDFKGYVSICVKYPSISEQQRIVSLLDAEFAKIDALKANAEKNLQNAKDLFQAALKKELEPKEGWKWSYLPSISENLDSKRIPITQKDRIEGVYPYYGASGIVDYVSEYLFDDDLLLISEDGANLLARSTPIAFSVSGKIWVNNHAHILKFKDMATQKIVEYYFASILIDEFITGAAQPKLTQANLNKIAIPMPPTISDQQSIVARLDVLNEKCKTLQTNYEKTIALCDDLKQALLRKTFNGEI